MAQRLKDAGQYESVGGAAYLLELSQEVATAAHAEYYARIVRDKAVLRSLIHASTDIIQEAYETGVDAREMLARAEERVFRILDTKGDTQVRPVREVLHESLARIDARMQHQHAYGGLETGLHRFRRADRRPARFGAGHPGRPAQHGQDGAGAEHCRARRDRRRRRKPVLVVSLEMSALELGDRLLCSRARVNSHRLRNGQLSAEDSRRLVQTAADVSRAPLFIDDSPSRNMTEIAATARRLKRQEDLALIVIDYLQLIEPDNPRDPRQEQVARISRRLKGLARELSVPVLCLAQLNRQVEATRDNKPQLSHLRESGAIEQDADVVMFVHREEFYQTNEEDRERVQGPGRPAGPQAAQRPHRRRQAHLAARIHALRKLAAARIRRVHRLRAREILSWPTPATRSSPATLPFVYDANHELKSRTGKRFAATCHRSRRRHD